VSKEGTKALIGDALLVGYLTIAKAIKLGKRSWILSPFKGIVFSSLRGQTLSLNSLWTEKSHPRWIHANWRFC